MYVPLGNWNKLGSLKNRESGIFIPFLPFLVGFTSGGGGIMSCWLPYLIQGGPFGTVSWKLDDE